MRELPPHAPRGVGARVGLFPLRACGHRSPVPQVSAPARPRVPRIWARRAPCAVL